MTSAIGVEVRAPAHPLTEQVLTPEALAFIGALHREFEGRRQDLLAQRRERQSGFDAGALPDFLPETKAVREGAWRVAAPPPDLRDRRVEITGPTERKMVINALNSGAKVFMADFEDANTPTWANLIEGQQNLTDAIERTISFDNPDGRVYRLNETTATLLVRPRGWHLDEKHVLVEGRRVSGGLFDFGLYFIRNAERLRARDTGPYFYLPKMESHREARLWDDVFLFAQERLGLPRGTVRATVLIETVLAAFEMEEVLHELREHSSGLNAGRWDYIFSLIKKFHARADMITPDRASVTMTVPFMRAYTELLVKTCHRRGTHAIGGMAAFIPNRRDAAVTEAAVARVREDKLREANDGFDGTWVAHPDLVPVAMAVFDAVLGERPNQVERQREDVSVSAADMLGLNRVEPRVTEPGLRNNVGVAIQYIDSWLRGAGAAAINNLMEDAATAEISRSQVWQWLNHGARLEDGSPITAERVRRLEEEEVARLRATLGEAAGKTLDQARALFDKLAMGRDFVEFLTFPAYELID